MNDEAPRTGGLFASVRQLASTAFEIAQVRLQLFGTELEQEKLRLFDGLILAGVGLMLFSVGTVLLCGLIVMLFAEGYRIPALAVMTLAFVAGGVFVMRAGGQRLRGNGHMFQATLGELARDRDQLAARD